MRRLCLTLALLLASGCRAVVEDEAHSARWAAWRADERLASAYRRTRLELEAFSRECAPLAGYWSDVVDLHESRRRVVVFDVRHNWNGLGDSHERLNFVLRVGRGLGRAAYLWCDVMADPAGPPRHPGVQPERVVRNHSEGMFDPGAFVTGFGGVSWRWVRARRVRVATQGWATDATDAAYPAERR